MKKLSIYVMAALLGGAIVSCEKEEVNESTSDTNNTYNTLGEGQGGSMAQFTIIDNYLYTVDYKSLKVFLISDAANPQLLETVDLGVGIETIFPQNDHLFIGTQNGVLIYDVTNPRSPEEVSEFEHVTSCDPVVANDNLAFATLRGGTPCGGNLNQLDIINISDLANPQLVTSQLLTNPYGLGLSVNDANLVYVCDGYAGFRAFDFSEAFSVSEVMHMEEIEAIDVIDTEGSLIVLSRQGIYQYDASNPTELVEKSFISVQ